MTGHCHAGEILAAARAAPVIDLQRLTRNAPILILSPHPDDESLGCGGLIAACVAADIPVEVALLTDGSGSHPGSLTHPPDVLGRLRAAEMVAALQALGIEQPDLHEMGWPDAAAPLRGRQFQRAVSQLVALVQMTRAACIVAAWGSDPHCDHEAGEAIAAAAAHQTHARHLAYPVWGWTLPDHAPVRAGPPMRLHVRPDLHRKRAAVACHRSQHGLVVRDSPAAFVLPDGLLAACLTDYEVFFDQGSLAVHGNVKLHDRSFVRA